MFEVEVNGTWLQLPGSVLQDQDQTYTVTLTWPQIVLGSTDMLEGLACRLDGAPCREVEATEFSQVVPKGPTSLVVRVRL